MYRTGTCSLGHHLIDYVVILHGCNSKSRWPTVNVAFLSRRFLSMSLSRWLTRQCPKTSEVCHRPGKFLFGCEQLAEHRTCFYHLVVHLSQEAAKAKAEAQTAVLARESQEAALRELGRLLEHARERATPSKTVNERSGSLKAEELTLVWDRSKEEAGHFARVMVSGLLRWSSMSARHGAT